MAIKYQTIAEIGEGIELVKGISRLVGVKLTNAMKRIGSDA